MPVSTVLHRTLVVCTSKITLFLITTTLSIRLLPRTNSFWPILAIINGFDWLFSSITTYFTSRRILASHPAKRILTSLFDGFTWILCNGVVLAVMCAAYVAGKALSQSNGTSQQAAEVVVFGVAMPVFKTLFVKYVLRICMKRIGSRVATSTEALRAGRITSRVKVVDVVDVEDVGDGKGAGMQKETEMHKEAGEDAMIRGTRMGDTMRQVMEAGETPSSEQTRARDGRCDAGEFVKQDPVIADAGLVRMILGFEAGFGMVDTLIILQNADNIAFALSITGSHIVHFGQAFIRGTKWRRVLNKAQLQTGGPSIGLNTWLAITTSDGAAAYVTAMAAMVMLLWFDHRGALDKVPARATQAQVAVRTMIAMVLKILLLGGTLEDDESTRKRVKREVKEEVKTDVKREQVDKSPGLVIDLEKVNIPPGTVIDLTD
ncbi:hypothetical protein HK104_000211 [Borealophlyctis nickersoniae]|nr:hypothetical protein HK104_000211 [Borealophlyctis nickersoniae]